MNCLCISCKRIKEAVLDVSDNGGRAGSLCRQCELRSSSRIEILVIDGRQFVRTLKRGPVAVEKSKKKAVEVNVSADARLIASAPALLEALKGLLGDVDDNPDIQGGICHYCGRDYIEDMLSGNCPSDDCPANVARAAISAAEGE